MTELHATQCDVCDVTDTAPKHVVVFLGWVQRRHMDCCAGAGCINGSCNVVLAMAVSEDGTVARDEDLRDVILDPRRDSEQVL